MDPTLLIGDIVERDSSQRKPVDFPDAPISSTGFPQHKRRWRPSAFKQQRTGKAEVNTPKPEATSRHASPQVQDGSSLDSHGFEAEDRKRIDRENQQKLAEMTPEEIAQAQQDLMNGLNPALVQRLLQRSTIDDSGSDSLEPRQPVRKPEAAPPPEINVTEAESVPKSTEPAPAVSSDKKHDNSANAHKHAALDFDEDAEPPQMPPDLFPITDLPERTHFPVAPALPDLDPSDPNFLETLRQKYFPNLAADPSKLAWMAPVPSKDSVADKDSSYYPHPEISVSALRFDFKGRFLSPRVSRSIPSSVGLHHHGEAPEAAGYTIGELSRLARSAVPAQRCIAFQTLGRIMYRLGQGEWGKTEYDPIAMGVWSSIKEGRVLETLEEAAANEGGHRGSQAYATEALWLFEKGGWREKVRGR